MYKMVGRGYTLVPVAHDPKRSWRYGGDGSGIRIEARCRFCGKKHKGVISHRHRFECRSPPKGRIVGRLVPIKITKKAIPDKENLDGEKDWDFVCRQCEPRRLQEWCDLQGIRVLKGRK